MGLLNIFDFENKKSLKLSDSYRVFIKLNKNDFADSTKKNHLFINAPDNYIFEFLNCIDVKIPEFSYTEEVFKYGNNSKLVLIPNPESLDDLSLDFYEYYYDRVLSNNSGINDNSTQIHKKGLFIKDFVNFALNKLFDQRSFTYIMNSYIPEIRINIVPNNALRLPINKYGSENGNISYVFKNLKLTDYTIYGLDYSSTDLAKWSLKFSYTDYSIEEDGEIIP